MLSHPEHHNCFSSMTNHCWILLTFIFCMRGHEKSVVRILVYFNTFNSKNYLSSMQFHDCTKWNWLFLKYTNLKLWQKNFVFIQSSMQTSSFREISRKIFPNIISFELVSCTVLEIVICRCLGEVITYDVFVVMNIDIVTG